MMRNWFWLAALGGCVVSSPATNDLGVSGNGVCVIGGATWHAGAVNSANPCQSCQPERSAGDWSSVANGLGCGDDHICADGSCESTSGCAIAGMQVGTGMPNPANPCQVCRPSSAAGDWSERADGTGCGSGRLCSSHSCVSACFIGGAIVLPGAAPPDNPCQSCQPLSTTGAYSTAADGTGCGGNMFCIGGACMAATCIINGGEFQPGDVNPLNPCQSCQPARSFSQWSSIADGTACNGSMVCIGGGCVATPINCTISGQTVAAGTIDRGNLCRSCQPGVSATQYSDLADGDPCGFGATCIAGSCGNGCKIAGVYYTGGYRNPANPCQACQLGASDWSTLVDGTTCGTNKVCNTGTCYDHCNIDGSSQPLGAPDPANPCLGCQPGESLTAWTAFPSGVSCGTGAVCVGSTCANGCTIGGNHVAIGAVNPQNSCQECQPIFSLSDWSGRPFGTSCGVNQICDFFGVCSGGCKIAGTVYLDGDSVGNCTICNSSVSATAPAPAPEGAFCFTNPSGDMGSSGGVCHAQICQSGCFIDGVFHAAGEVNPANSCLECRPGNSSKHWSGREGVSCGANTFCDFSGFCRNGCSVGGKFYSSGQSVGPCTFCNPAVSTTIGQPVAEGTTCSDFSNNTVGVCHDQTCQNGCYISAALDMSTPTMFFPAGTLNPGNPCQACRPDFGETIAWSPVPDGTACGGGHFCNFGVCQ